MPTPSKKISFHIEEQRVLVKKNTAGTLTEGQWVYRAGYDTSDNTILVELAKADSSSTMPSLGVIDDGETVTDTQEGTIIIKGIAKDQNTSSFSDAPPDELFISATTAGEATETKPTGSSVIEKVGQVLRSHATQGVLEVYGGGIAIDSAGDINGYTEKASPVGADILLIEDSAASNAKKKVKLSNLPVTSGDLPCVVARDATGNANIPTTWTDLNFDNTDVENDTDIVEHDNTNTDRITVKETGLYMLSWSFECDDEIQVRVRKNDTTVLNGSTTQAGDPGDVNDVHVINARTLAVSLTASDYLTIQIQANTTSEALVAGGTFMVMRVKGVKGDAGPAGEALPVADTTAVVKGSSDATKQVRLEVDGLTTATTRVITVPDQDLTLIDTADSRLSDSRTCDNTFDSASTSRTNLDVYSTSEVDGKVVGLYDHKGAYNASTNTPDLDTSPSGVLKGDAYTVSAAGNFFTEAVEIGDVLIADQDSPTLLSHWTRVNKNISFGTTAGTACEGDDSRLTDSRAPTNHASDHTDGTDDIQNATSGQKGLMTSAYASKLDGIEASADVTDATNVAAAGAVMDSDISPAEGFLRKTGAGAYTAIKSNLSASAAPTTTDDSGSGYAVGSRWIDTTADKEYVCLDATATSAVWTETTQGAGGSDTKDINISWATKTAVGGFDSISIKTDTYTTMSNFIFKGTTALGTPTKMYTVAWGDSDLSFDIKIYDVTNSLQIAEITTQSNTSKAILDMGTLSNLPTGQSLLEVQVKGSVSNKVIYLAALSVQW